MFFVVQKKHKVNNTWENNIHTKETVEEAMHQFHAFMSTYGYGFDETVNYAGCDVQTDDGREIKSEVDDRRGIN